MNSKHAWGVLGAYVVGWELHAARRGLPLLSEIIDEWLVSHPVLTYGTIFLLAAHLANVWDSVGLQSADPIHLIAMSFGYVKRGAVH
uniref:DUF7427 family protein n=1 Tax=Tsukamurella tyrosinosolvens TaxID=57704 RepID=UPI003F58BABB